MRLKKILSLLGVITILAGILPIPVHAISSATGSCVDFDACFYSETVSQADICDVTLGGSAGSGPLYGPRFPKVDDTQKLADAIKAYIGNTKPNSPFNDQGVVNKLVALGVQYDVSPAFATAQLQIENSFATVGYGRPPQNNAFNIRNGSSGFRSYSDYTASMEDYYKLISGKLYLGPPSNFTSIEQILNRYAPPSENQTNLYLATTLQIVQKIMKPFENGSTTQAATDPTTTNTATSSCSTSSGGEIGWKLTGSGALVNYDQTDPKYSNHPYGKGKTPIGESGCGPTSVAMVVATLTGDKSINPITIADKYGDQYHTSAGSSHELFTTAAKDYNLNMVNLGTDLSKVPEIIKAGGLVIISVDPGYFTNNGHIMVIRAITTDGTGFYLADPNGQGLHGDSETKSYDAAFLQGQGALKGIWGYTKK